MSNVMQTKTANVALDVLQGNRNKGNTMASHDFCNCGTVTDKKLMFAFAESVLCCMNCNLPINQKKEEDQAVGKWRVEYESIYNLWLSSGDYEEWADAELNNINSKINQSGLKIAQRRGSFYWLHRSDESEMNKNEDNCPSCGTKLEKCRSKTLNQKVCRKCWIVLGA